MLSVFKTVYGEQVERCGVDLEFEFQTDPVHTEVEVRSGRLASRGANFEFEFETDPLNDAQPAINTQQEAFHPAFRGLSTPINKRGTDPVHAEVEVRSGRRARRGVDLNLNLKLIQSPS